MIVFAADAPATVAELTVEQRMDRLERCFINFSVWITGEVESLTDKPTEMSAQQQRMIEDISEMRTQLDERGAL